MKKKLRETLRESDSIDWYLALYLPKDVSSWELESLAMIEDPDDVNSDDPDDDPDIVKDEGYRYVMGVQTVQSIVKNLNAQNINFSDEDLFKAFIYYFKYDAFIKV